MSLSDNASDISECELKGVSDTSDRSYGELFILIVIEHILYFSKLYIMSILEYDTGTFFLCYNHINYNKI